MMRARLLSFAHTLHLLLVLLPAAGAMGAQQRDAVRPLAIAHALDVRFINGVALSPDASLLAYVACRRTSVNMDAFYLPSGFVRTAAGCAVRVTRTSDGTPVSLDLGKPGNVSVQPAWSPDGRYLAYVSDRDGFARVWLVDRASGQSRRVSPIIVRHYDPRREGGLQWSPDGRLLLVKVLPAGMTLPQANLVVENALWGPDVAPLNSPIDEPNVLVYRTTPGVPQKPSLPDPLATDRDTIAVPDTFAVNARALGYQGDVALVDVASGAALVLTQGANGFWYRFSPDGRYVAVNDWKGAVPNDALVHLHEFTVFRVADALPIQRVRYAYPTSNRYAVDANWSPSSKLVSFSSCRFLAVGGKEIDLRTAMGGRECGRYWDANEDVLYQLTSDGGTTPHTALWRIVPATKEVTKVAVIPGTTGQLLLSADQSRVWSSRAGSIMAITRDSLFATAAYRIHIGSGKVHQVWKDEKTLGSGPFEHSNRDLSRDGNTFVFEAEDAAHPAELWLTDSSFSKPRQLTQVNDHLAGYAFGKTKVVEWFGGRDGRRHRGVLFLPPDYSPGKRYPVVAWVYPGTHVRSRTEFGGLGTGIFNFQLWTTRGYVVFYPDVFAFDGTPADDIASSVLSGIDKLVELGIADSARLGVAGHSQGGYSTMAIITRTTRFKAAMAYAGHYDLFKDYGELSATGIAESVTRLERPRFPNISLGGSPWEYPERYIDNNLMFDLDRIVTPVLLVVGGRDGMMVAQAQAAFVGLRRLGKTAELALYPNEGHTMMNPPNQADYLSRFIGWFDRHLGPREAAN